MTHGRARPRAALFDLLLGAADKQHIVLDASAAQQFVQATGHGAEDLAAGLAPTLWACACALPAAASGLVRQLPKTTTVAMPLPQLVATEITFGEPAALDTTLALRAEVVGVGDYGAHHGLRLASVLALPDMPPVATVYATIVAGTARGVSRLPAAPSRLKPGEPIAAAAAELPGDLPRRFAQATGDFNPLHLDDDAARAAGFPAAIVHGMATLSVAIATSTRSCPQLAGRALRRLSARMARPVFAGGDLGVRVFETAEADGFRLGVTCSEQQVLKDVELWVA